MKNVDIYKNYLKLGPLSINLKVCQVYH